MVGGGVITQRLKFVFNRFSYMNVLMCAVVGEHRKLGVFIHLMQRSVPMFTLDYRSGYPKTSESLFWSLEMIKHANEIALL